MADTTAPPPKRRRWLRRLLWLFAGLFVVLIAAYFVVTSAAFFKGVILPKAGQALNARITVDDASIKPFSQVLLRNLKVQTTGPEPLLTVQEVRARYGLREIIGGNIQVDEVVISSPLVQIIENADGTSNLDPILKAEKKEQSAKPPTTKPSQPPRVDLKKFALNNATVRMVKLHKNGQRDLTELSNVNIAVENVKNGQTGKVGLAADIKVDNNPPPPGTNALLVAKVSGNLSLSLSGDLKPSAVSGETKLTVEKAGGAFNEVAGLSANLQSEVTPTEIKQVALRFQKAGANLGEVRVSGPFDMAKTEGRLNVQILSIDRQVLNLVGGASGIDFGTTTINSTNQIELAQAGNIITALGQLNVAKMSLTRERQTTPPLDVQFAYNVAVHQTNKSARLQAINLLGTQNQKPILRAELTSPMTVSWGGAAPSTGDSALKLIVTDFNLSDWKAFVGDVAPAGNVSLTANLLSQQSGKQLVLDISSQIDGLTARLGSNEIKQAGATLQVKGQATDLKTISLSDYRLQLTQQGQPMLSIAGSGQFDSEKKDADLQVNMEAALAKLSQVLGQPNVSITAGTVNLKGRVIQKQTTQTVTGNLTLAALTGRYGDYQFNNFGVGTDLDVEKKDQLVQIRKAAGTVREGANAGGSFDVNGNYNLEKQSGELTFKLVDINQNAVRPFLESMLGDKKLVSVSVNSTATARYDARGESAIKADLQVAKLVVSDPKKQFPETPLEAKVQLDSSLNKQVLDLRQAQVSLTPTARAKNQLQLSGKIDMSKTNAVEGGLKLSAESLDVTPYYDLFAEKPKATAEKSSPKATAPAAPQSQPGNQEPAAVKLPIRALTMDVNIGRFYLREIAITNFHLAEKIEGSRISMPTFELAVNGAPIKSQLDMDLGVRGYRYEMALNGDKIPLEPLANSFLPDKKGMYKGEMLMNVQLKGAGMTGASLQKNLNGQCNFTFTNANIQIVSPRLKRFLTPVSILLRAPDLLDSPLNWVVVASEMGNGKIKVNTLNLVSPTFIMTTAGEMPIAEVLTNSPFHKWPVDFYLRRSLAQKIGMLPANTPPDAAYVKMPNFLQIVGTLGDPKADINERALAGSIVGRVVEKVPGLNEKTGGLLGGLGNVLSGSKTATNNPSTVNTNQPATTNKPPAKLNPFDFIPKPKK
jgi:AsmA family